MRSRLLELIYPRKCVFCTCFLKREETDLCTGCRTRLPYCEDQRRSIPYSAKSVSVFYYEGDVREAVLRYKFGGQMHYSHAFGRLIAMQVRQHLPEFDLICHVPVSRARRRARGYDQAKRLADAVGAELGNRPRRILKKLRNNPAQSGLQRPEQRRANVLGVYAVPDREAVRGKTILLIDDVMTTGATLSECCRTLLDAGAAQVYCAVLARSHRNEELVRT